MKKLHNIINQHSILSTSAALFIAAVLAITFWFASAPRASAATCTLCHKRTQTINTECGSLDHRRHVDHGDTAGACDITPKQNP